MIILQSTDISLKDILLYIIFIYELLPIMDISSPFIDGRALKRANPQSIAAKLGISYFFNYSLYT